MDHAEREQLDVLIQQNETKDWWTPELFENYIQSKLPTALTVIAPPPIAARNYNCFIYTLGLAQDQDILRDSEGFIYSAFLQKLLDIGALRKTQEAVPGDYICYQDLENYPKEITHSGVVQADGSIVSKWAWGPLIKHQTLDVPASYGDSIWYVSAIEAQDAANLYWKYKAFNLKPELA